MKTKHTISLEEASGILHAFKNMSSKDKKRFAQCFNCKNLETCTRDETDEDENGMCNFYNELPEKELKDFAAVFNREMQRIIKEDNENA